MSCLAEHDICNSSVPCIDYGCHGFRTGKRLAARDEHGSGLDWTGSGLKPI